MLKSNTIRTRGSATAIALAACLAAPSAFAQDAQSPPQPPQPVQDAPPATDSQAADKPAEKSWSELDADNNGSLSTSEVAAMPSLAKVFVKADADADGELTQDEYRTWLAANGSKQQPTQGG
jgi:hypothetical protein